MQILELRFEFGKIRLLKFQIMVFAKITVAHCDSVKFAANTNMQLRKSDLR